MSDLERMVERLVAERDAANAEATLAAEQLAEAQERLEAFGPQGAYYVMGYIEPADYGDRQWRFDVSDGQVRMSGSAVTAEEAATKVCAEIADKLTKNITNEWRLDND